MREIELRVSQPLIEDYEARFREYEDKVNNLAADLLEERSQRQHAIRERDEALATANVRAGQLMASRVMLDEATTERDEARAEVVRLGRENEQLRARNQALVAWYTSELERLRTIIGELGAAEAAEPQDGDPT